MFQKLMFTALAVKMSYDFLKKSVTLFRDYPTMSVNAQ